MQGGRNVYVNGLTNFITEERPKPLRCGRRLDAKCDAICLTLCNTCPASVALLAGSEYLVRPVVCGWLDLSFIPVSPLPVSCP